MTISVNGRLQRPAVIVPARSSEPVNSSASIHTSGSPVFTDLQLVVFLSRAYTPRLVPANIVGPEAAKELTPAYGKSVIAAFQLAPLFVDM